MFVLLALMNFASGAEKVGLVLSGGGGRGAYEIGVWKALMDLNVNVGGVYGTSVGSINGAGILMGDFEMLKHIWLSTDYDDVMEVSPEVRKIIEGNLSSLSVLDVARILRKLFAGVDIDPLRIKLRELIDERKVRSSNLDYGLVAYSLSKMRPVMLYLEDIPEGQLVDYILASSNFPVFKRESFGGENYIDGGIYSNIPIELAIKRGYKKIIAVDIGTYGLTDILNFLGGYRSKADIIFIKPRTHFGTVLTFNPEVSKKYMLEGYLDTLSTLGILNGEKYYIHGNEDIFEELFMSLSASDIKDVFNALNLKYIEDVDKKFLYYRVFLPYLESLAGTNGKAPFYTCQVLLDDLASLYDVEWLRLYNTRELLTAIIVAYEKSDVTSFLQSFMRNVRYGKLLEGLKLLFYKGKMPVDDEEYIEMKKRLEELVTIN
ncbi:patatin-like phospholipase family protein [Kosmotoga pacifica]|uniref:patatin-like phospholipase family protein n=1 Tax=Kosmotoga pacifica TaxID=1330330 RepID=UPI002353EE15|nr:patatin-like phospholipase family protein [Kosmotoga pacifica]